MRRLVRGLGSALLGLGIAGALGIAYDAFGQQAAPQQAVSCEQKLEEAQLVIVQMRKRAAQAEFQAAAVEEVAMGMKKQLEAEQAKNRAAEKK